MTNEYFSKSYQFSLQLEYCLTEMICQDCGAEIDNQEAKTKYNCLCNCHNLI